MIYAIMSIIHDFFVLNFEATTSRAYLLIVWTLTHH